MDPEQGLLVIGKDLAVEGLVFLVGAVLGGLGPEGMNVVDKLGPSADLQLLFPGLFPFLRLLLLQLLDHHILGLSFGLFDDVGHGGIGFRQIDLHGHEGAVLFKHFLCPVIVGELGAVVGQMQGDCGAEGIPLCLFQAVLASAVALPVDRGGVRLIGLCIDGDHVGDHESGIEAQAEVADDLVAAGLVLIFLKEGFRAGEGDVVDIFTDFVGGHAKAVVCYLNGLFGRVRDHVDAGRIALGKFKIAHHIQLFQLGDGIAAVGDQFP